MYKFFYNLIFKKIDAELSHTIGLFFLKYFSFLFIVKLQNQEVDFFGKKIPNRIGIGAGFDKNGEAIKGIFNLGFGFVEIGTVTPKPQKGNPKPRIFRVGEGDGIINRMGFPNLGAEVALSNLRAFKKQSDKIVGVNIGRNKTGVEDDYIFLINYFIQDADYITINISSPNTEGLRNMEREDELAKFLSKIKTAREGLAIKKPFFLKISPDVSAEDIKYIYRLLVENNIEGIIMSNTTLSRPNLGLQNEAQAGGLSGKFVKQKAVDLLKEFNAINKHGIVVISLGGVQTKEDYEERLKNGASFVQVYTGLVFEGPFLLSKIL